MGLVPKGLSAFAQRFSAIIHRQVTVILAHVQGQAIYLEFGLVRKGGQFRPAISNPQVERLKLCFGVSQLGRLHPRPAPAQVRLRRGLDRGLEPVMLGIQLGQLLLKRGELGGFGQRRMLEDDPPLSIGRRLDWGRAPRLG